MKNKFTFFTSRLPAGTVFLGIFISIFCSLFIFQFSFSANLKTDILDGLTKSTPTLIQQQNSNFNDVIAKVVGTALSLIAVVFFVLVVYGGFLYMTASGNEDQAKKGKDVVIASAIGVIIIMSSYTLIQFIFSTVEGDNTGPEKINTCKEYNPNWDCMDASKCAYTDGDLKYTKGLPGEIETSCTSTNNCVRGKCLADGKHDDDNFVCCLPYKSLCELNNPGYKCVSKVGDCTSAQVTPSAGLCTTENDGGEFCCDSRVVWGYDNETTYFDELGKEGQTKTFNCVSATGTVGLPLDSITNSIFDKETIKNENIGKYQFNSEEECQLYGETEKIFCLKYSKEDTTYYCAELLKGDSTRDCAETSNRLFMKKADVNFTEVSCIEARDIYNK